jgi:hypothetical protein
MRFCYYILIALSLGCYKKNEDIEAIPIEKIVFKTTLKDHTPGVDYIINKTIEVLKDLIIEEGVEIMVSNGSELLVLEGGSLHCNGTASKPIVFRNQDESGSWKGIIISSKEENQLDYTHIKGAGSLGLDHAALEVNANGNITLSNCRIEYNGTASGLLIAEFANCRIGDNCQFNHNDFPIQMDLHATLSIGNNFSCNDNANNGIRIKNRDGSELRTRNNVTFNNYGLPYCVTSSIVLDQKTLTVNPGCSFMFEAGCGFISSNNMSDINASLVLNGGANAKINLGSLHSGDVNLWSGIRLSKGKNKIYHANFAKCNSPNKEFGPLLLTAYAQVDCKYSNFIADKSFCNISLIGKYVSFNGDIGSRNTFSNGLLPCIFL